MWLYVAGPVTGWVRSQEEFEQAAEQLRAWGYDVVSPLELGIDPETAWGDAMRTCIHKMLDCDALAVLKGWERSRGAKVEVALASAIGMAIKPVAGWAR